jgi:antitoxin FitA
VAHITVLDIPEATHFALQARAQSNGRSTEGEIHVILDQALMDTGKPGLGTAMFRIGRSADLSDEEFALISAARDLPDVAPLNLE